ncbi:zf-CCHC domain containing protein [Trichuris trichiura]|uniref:Zf-CCHC domain containing protein n=1 Tax=Trichuris trichiura TaxID=36087 RepID=A0A077Z6I9_TRITR|nr:zf-CCHC domain containing protein [Trichuris trichiura]
MDTCGTDGLIDVQLIPEFDGLHGQSIMEWLKKVELVCELYGVKDIASVIPLRLTGGAFAVYLQLPDDDRKNVEKVKQTLLSAFAADPFVAYHQFVSRRLGSTESPDVFLAELRRLASLCDIASEKTLAYAFVAGLPEGVRELLGAGCRMDDLNLAEILARARAILTRPAAVGDACLGARQSGPTAQTTVPGLRCYACGGPNHFARDCLATRQNSSVSNRGDGHDLRHPVRNRGSRRRGAATSCLQENEARVEESAPAFFPRDH